MTKTNNIPKDWKWVKLGDVCDLQNGFAFKSTDYVENSKTLVFRMSQIRPGGSLDLNHNSKYLPDNFIEKHKSYLLNDGDVVIAMTDMATETKILGLPTYFKSDGRNFLLNQRVGKLFDFNTKEVEVKYLRYILTAPNIIQYYKSFGKGALQINLGKSDILNAEFPLPPLATQQAIVSKIEELFSELDNGIAQLKTAQQQLKTYRQSVLKWAFEGKLTEEWRLVGMAGIEPTTSKNKKSRKSINPTNHGLDNKLNAEREGFAPPDLPEGWKWVKLGDVCYNVEYGSAAKSKDTGKIPVLRMGNIQNGRIDWSDLVYTDDDNEIKRYLLKKDDVLFNRTNSAELVGKTAIYKGERPAIFAGYLIRINRIESLIDADYLTYYLNTHSARQYGNSVRSFGVNQSNINGTKLKTYPLPLPSLKEQHQIIQEIESRLSVADKLEESISASLQQAEALRQSILKRAFEGRLI